MRCKNTAFIAIRMIRCVFKLQMHQNPFSAGAAQDLTEELNYDTPPDPYSAGKGTPLPIDFLTRRLQGLDLVSPHGATVLGHAYVFTQGAEWFSCKGRRNLKLHHGSCYDFWTLTPPPEKCFPRACTNSSPTSNLLKFSQWPWRRLRTQPQSITYAFNFKLKLHNVSLSLKLAYGRINLSILIITRKLSYRKDNRAMRPIYGCPENFSESVSTPSATFAEIFNGLLFRMCVQNLKFVALPTAEIIGVLKNSGSPCTRSRSLFSQIFNGILFGWSLGTYICKILSS